MEYATTYVEYLAQLFSPRSMHWDKSTNTLIYHEVINKKFMRDPGQLLCILKLMRVKLIKMYIKTPTHKEWQNVHQKNDTKLTSSPK